MSTRDSNARVQVGGLNLRGNVSNLDLGGVKRTAVTNADGSVDMHEELTPGMLDIKLSMVADTDVPAIEAILEEPMLVTYSNGRKVKFPSMSFSEKSPIDDKGEMPVKFAGRKGSYV